MRLLASQETGNLYRQIKVIMNLDMIDALKIGAKILIAADEKNLSKEEMDRIRDSKDIEEIANILKKHL